MTPLPLSSPPRRILLIKPSAIGDVVHALPVLHLLRSRWPEARISWLITPLCAGLVEGHPEVDEVIRFDRPRFGRAWRSPSAAWALHRFNRDLRRRRFDLVIDLQGLFRSGWMAMRTGAPMRIGFAKAREGAPLFYTHRIRTGSPEQHAIDRYLTIAEGLGCGREPVEFHFPTDAADRADIAARVGPDRRFAVLLPGANWLSKRWPVAHFAALVRPLRERFGLEAIIAGGRGDVELASQIPHALNLAGKTTLRQLVALLERAELVIANDSGPMHIAAALGRPLVTLFGPTNPTRTGPWGRADSVVRLGLDCSPCYARTCPLHHHNCLGTLGIETVLAAAQRQLEKKGGAQATEIHG